MAALKRLNYLSGLKDTGKLNNSVPPQAFRGYSRSVRCRLAGLFWILNEIRTQGVELPDLTVTTVTTVTNSAKSDGRDCRDGVFPRFDTPPREKKLQMWKFSNEW